MKLSVRDWKLVRNAGITVILVVAVLAAFSPSATHPDTAQIARPYFSENDSYFARGNFINLDEVEDATLAADETDKTPRSPEQLWTVAGTNTVSLNWTRQPHASGYQVHYRPTNQTAYQTADVTSPFFAVRNARADATYEFSVATVYPDGAISDPSPLTAVTPTALTQTTSVERQAFEVGAWLPPGWENQNVQDSFERGTGVLTSINPFWYNFTTSGKLEAKGSARNPEVIARAHQSGMRVVFTVTNNYDPKRVSAFLKNDELQAEFTKAVITELKENDYDGVDLDFENVVASDKEAFTKFVESLAKSVHDAGKTIELTGQAKKSDDDNWNGPGSLDLAALAPHIDRFKPMLYDYSRPDSEPGPLAPLSWIREVLSYWKSKVGAEKIQAALPLYGYDWSLSTDDDVGIQYIDVQHIKSKYDTQEARDSRSAEITLAYADENGPRTVYYQDAESVRQKVAVVRALGIEAVTFWLLGGEDPGSFSAIRDLTVSRSVTLQKPLNIGLKLKGSQLSVTVSKSSEVADVTVFYGSSADELTHKAEHQTVSLIDLPDLAPGEARYVQAIAYDSAGKEIRKSGIAYIRSN